MTKTFRNNSDQRVQIYFYLGNQEELIEIEPKGVADVVYDTLSQSTINLLTSGLVSVLYAAPPATVEAVTPLTSGMIWAGAWSASARYARGYVVTLNGNTWIAVRSNLNSAPSAINQDWELGGASDLESIIDVEFSSLDSGAVVYKLGDSWVAGRLPAESIDGDIPTSKIDGLDAIIAGLVPTSGGTMTGALTLPGDPTASLHAATKAYADTKLSKAGGTMTGALLISPSVPISNARQAVPKSYVDDSASGKLSKSGGTMTGLLTLSGAPVNDLHAATKVYADTKLSKAGGTMTGLLTLSGAPTLDLHAATKAYADLAGRSGGTFINQITLPSAPTAAMHAATKSYVDSADSGLVPKAGGTMTGLLTLSGAPTLDMHAATKAYADTKLSKAGGTMTGLLTLSGAPTSALHAATKAYVDNATGNSADVLLKSGGEMEGAITGLHGLLPVDGSGEMTGSVRLAQLPDEKVSGLLALSTSSGGVGFTWVTLSSVAGIDVGDVLLMSGSTNLDGQHVITEVDAGLTRVKIAVTFSSSDSGDVTILQPGLHQSASSGGVAWRGKSFQTQGRAVSVASDYDVVEGDGTIMASSAASLVIIRLGSAESFSTSPITVKKINRGYDYPVMVVTQSGGRSSDFMLKYVGESITVRAVDGQWEVVSRYGPSQFDNTTVCDGVILTGPGAAEVDLSCKPRIVKSTMVTAVTSGGGGNISFEVEDPSEFEVGGSFTIEGSLGGYNGTYVITGISGSVITGNPDGSNVFGSDDPGCCLYGIVLRKQSILMSAAISRRRGVQLAQDIEALVAGAESAGSGYTWLLLTTVGDAEALNTVVVVTGTANYDGSYIVEEVDVDGIRVKIPVAYVSSQSGSCTLTRASSLSQHPSTFGRITAADGSGAVVAIRTMADGTARMKIDAAVTTSQLSRSFLHPMSGGEGNAYGLAEAAVSDCYNFWATITGVESTGPDYVWLNVSSVRDWAAGDTAKITDNGTYDDELREVLDFEVTDNVTYAGKVKISGAFSGTGKLHNMDVVNLVVSGASSLFSVSDPITARGITALGGSLVDTYVSAVDTVRVTVRLPFNEGGTTSGLIESAPVYTIPLLKPWSWLRGLPTLDGGSVLTWADISTNSRNFVAPSSGASPVITNDFNGVTGISAIQLFSTTHRKVTRASSPTGAFTLFLVIKGVSTTGGILFEGTGSGSNYIRLTASSSQLSVTYTGAGSGPLCGLSGALTSAQVVCLVSNGAGLSRIRTTGASSTVQATGSIGASPTPIALTAMNLGDPALAASFDGEVANVIVIDGALGLDDIEAIESALKYEHGI